MTMTLELNQICGVSLKLNDQIADFPQHLSLFIPVLIMRQENKEELSFKWSFKEDFNFVTYELNIHILRAT